MPDEISNIIDLTERFQEKRNAHLLEKDPATLLERSVRARFDLVLDVYRAERLMWIHQGPLVSILKLETLRDKLDSLSKYVPEAKEYNALMHFDLGNLHADMTYRSLSPLKAASDTEAGISFDSAASMYGEFVYHLQESIRNFLSSWTKTAGLPDDHMLSMAIDAKLSSLVLCEEYIDDIFDKETLSARACMKEEITRVLDFREKTDPQRTYRLFSGSIDHLAMKVVEQVIPEKSYLCK